MFDYQEPEFYYDKAEKTVHYCKECDDILPLSRKGIGICTESDEPVVVDKKKAKLKYINNSI